MHAFSKWAPFEKKSEANDEQMEVLEEVIKEMRKKNLVVDEKDGWEVEGDGWNDSSGDAGDMEQLKLTHTDLLTQKQKLVEQLQSVHLELETSNSGLSQHKGECAGLRSERDEVVKEFSETQNKLEVLTEFFNKKEAELQRQLGLQVNESPVSSPYYMDRTYELTRSVFSPPSLET